MFVVVQFGHERVPLLGAAWCRTPHTQVVMPVLATRMVRLQRAHWCVVAGWKVAATLSLAPIDDHPLFPVPHFGLPSVWCAYFFVVVEEVCERGLFERVDEDGECDDDGGAFECAH